MSLAQDLGELDTLAAARDLPAINLMPPRGASSPTGRTPEFDAAVQRFILAVEVALAHLDEYDAAVARNVGVTRKECRSIVLKRLAMTRDLVSAHDLARELGLSVDQVIDAFEQLESEGAIDGPKITPTNAPVQWMARLNAHGRDLAEGSAPTGATPVIEHHEYHNSAVVHARDIHGSVTQTVSTNADIVDVLAALEMLQAAAEREPAAIVVVSATRDAITELRTSGWSAKVVALLAALGGLVQTTASLKPAYAALQPIAAAHGVAIPPWP